MLKNLTVQVFLAAALGILLATIYQSITPEGIPSVVETITFLKKAFLALLKMLIAPMIFFSLIGGIISIGNVIRLRQLGGITIGYYLTTTGIAIALALIVVLFFHPWTAYEQVMSVGIDTSATRMLEPGSDSIIRILATMATLAFTNPFSALVDLNILGIVANAILIGVAMVLVLEESSPLFRLVHDINHVIVRILRWVIRILPVGIFAILFDFTLRLSSGEGHSEAFLTQLFQFGALVIGLTLIHGLIVLPTIAWLATGMSPVVLLGKITQPLLVAFSTSSSAATLPVSMRTAEEELGVSSSVSSFVLPLGATMNMDGTALFEAIAAVFLAYLYGVELSNVMLITVFLMAMVASIGAPGMPSASMSGMQMVLLAIGIPLEAIAILLVIERPLDTIRTSVNVGGDLIGSLVVDRYLRRQEAA
ncbi:MAG: dicarboxylate/amino acid:cation symporter [Gammaproteobacteria bacterium]|nr:dicarboxylate/amino acid:cation symporter [Gammaproteobacteria bacterium]MBT7370738.1 dicarboxylate/amino acid:cation symporter [Gammaproteobacteria bacterium]